MDKARDMIVAKGNAVLNSQVNDAQSKLMSTYGIDFERRSLTDREDTEDEGEAGFDFCLSKTIPITDINKVFVYFSTIFLVGPVPIELTFSLIGQLGVDIKVGDAFYARPIRQGLLSCRFSWTSNLAIRVFGCIKPDAYSVCVCVCVHVRVRMLLRWNSASSA